MTGRPIPRLPFPQRPPADRLGSFLGRPINIGPGVNNTLPPGKIPIPLTGQPIFPPNRPGIPHPRPQIRTELPPAPPDIRPPFPIPLPNLPNAPGLTESNVVRRGLPSFGNINRTPSNVLPQFPRFPPTSQQEISSLPPTTRPPFPRLIPSRPRPLGPLRVGGTRGPNLGGYENPQFELRQIRPALPGGPQLPRPGAPLSITRPIIPPTPAAPRIENLRGSVLRGYENPLPEPREIRPPFPGGPPLPRPGTLPPLPIVPPPPPGGPTIENLRGSVLSGYENPLPEPREIRPPFPGGPPLPRPGTPSPIPEPLPIIPSPPPGAPTIENLRGSVLSGYENPLPEPREIRPPFPGGPPLPRPGTPSPIPEPLPIIPSPPPGAPTIENLRGPVLEEYESTPAEPQEIQPPFPGAPPLPRPGIPPLIPRPIPITPPPPGVPRNDDLREHSLEGYENAQPEPREIRPPFPGAPPLPWPGIPPPILRPIPIIPLPPGVPRNDDLRGHSLEGYENALPEPREIRPPFPGGPPLPRPVVPFLQPRVPPPISRQIPIIPPQLQPPRPGMTPFINGGVRPPFPGIPPPFFRPITNVPRMVVGHPELSFTARAQGTEVPGSYKNSAVLAEDQKQPKVSDDYFTLAAQGLESKHGTGFRQAQWFDETQHDQEKDVPTSTLRHRSTIQSYADANPEVEREALFRFSPRDSIKKFDEKSFEDFQRKSFGPSSSKVEFLHRPAAEGLSFSNYVTITKVLPFDIKICVAVLVFAALFSVSYIFFESTLQKSRNLIQGWRMFAALRKDGSDEEWNLWVVEERENLAVAITGHVLLSLIVNNYYKKVGVSPTLISSMLMKTKGDIQLFYGIIIIYFLYGSGLVIVIAVMTYVFVKIGETRSLAATILVGSGSLYIIHLVPYANHDLIIGNLEFFPQTKSMLIYAIFRNCSIALEAALDPYVTLRINDAMQYNFYIPFFFFGPLMTYNGFISQKSPASNLLPVGLLFYLVKMVGYIIAVDFLRHFFYISSLATDEIFLRSEAPMVVVGFLAFANAYLDWLKSLFVYTFSSAIARNLDDFQLAPYNSKNIMTIFSFSETYFHRGLHPFVYRYVYGYISRYYKANIHEMAAAGCSFGIVLVALGLETHNIAWALVTWCCFCFEIILKNSIAVLAHSVQWTERGLALVCGINYWSILISKSIIIHESAIPANDYLHRLVYEDPPYNFFLTIGLGYCYARVLIELKKGKAFLQTYDPDKISFANRSTLQRHSISSADEENLRNMQNRVSVQHDLCKRLSMQYGITKDPQQEKLLQTETGKLRLLLDEYERQKQELQTKINAQQQLLLQQQRLFQEQQELNAKMREREMENLALEKKLIEKESQKILQENIERQFAQNRLFNNQILELTKQRQEEEEEKVRQQKMQLQLQEDLLLQKRKEFDQQQLLQRLQQANLPTIQQDSTLQIPTLPSLSPSLQNLSLSRQITPEASLNLRTLGLSNQPSLLPSTSLQSLGALRTPVARSLQSINQLPSPLTSSIQNIQLLNQQTTAQQLPQFARTGILETGRISVPSGLIQNQFTSDAPRTGARTIRIGGPGVASGAGYPFNATGRPPILAIRTPSGLIPISPSTERLGATQQTDQVAARAKPPVFAIRTPSGLIPVSPSTEQLGVTPTQPGPSPAKKQALIGTSAFLPGFKEIESWLPKT